MLKKTFYTLFVLGTMITIGSIASGFISAGTATEVASETIVEAETPFAGTWIAGKVSADGKKEAGTGSWTIQRTDPGDYFIESSSGKIVSLMVTSNDFNEMNKFSTVRYMKKGWGSNARYETHVYFYDMSDGNFGVGADTPFSFIAYVE